MSDRGLISLKTDNGPHVMKKNGSYFIPSNLFAVCNFDISLLPIKLKRQPFKIKRNFLKYLYANEGELVEYGLLMPQFLSSVNMKEVSSLLREFDLKDEIINKLCSFSDLFKFFN